MIALLLSSCTGPVLFGPQGPDREGLFKTLDQFESGTKWRNWFSLLEGFYLKDHQEEAMKIYGSDLKKWFRSDRAIAALSSGEVGDPRFLCVLALREKHFSPAFSPHFIVYYRVQKSSCEGRPSSPKGSLAEGQMEWGYEMKQQRWVHLRKLG